MNANAIFQGCPKDAEWYALDVDEHRQWATTLLNRALDDLVASGVQPDPWESTMLANGINALAARFYSLAVTDVALALTPKEKQSPWAKLEYFDTGALSIAMQHALARLAGAIR